MGHQQQLMTQEEKLHHHQQEEKNSNKQLQYPHRFWNNNKKIAEQAIRDFLLA
jgi:hypothetical protein